MDRIFTIALFFMFCTLKYSVAQHSKEIERIKSTYAWDKRTSIFEVKYDSSRNTIVGRTTSLDAYKSLKKVFGAKKVPVSVAVLPEGEKQYCVANIAEVNLRSTPIESAELASQMLLGTPMLILDKVNGWLKVQSPDLYIGYVDAGTVTKLSQKEFENYKSEAKVVYTDLFGKVYEDSSNFSLPKRDISLGAKLRLIETLGHHTKVKLPDGGIGFVPSKYVKPLEEYLNTVDSSHIVQRSFKFLGSPYLWGGTSSKGMDCSGFSRMAYFQCGYYLPRDASQQALVGKEVSVSSNFKEVKEGDLLFFGNTTTKRVSHVGIYIGKLRFIHSSDMVRINSFDPKDELYDAYNSNRLLFAKRINYASIKLSKNELYKDSYF
jgi:gamma-D-glutamyl-L-lysine dipeptidyl-peptidase